MELRSDKDKFIRIVLPILSTYGAFLVSDVITMRRRCLTLVASSFIYFLIQGVALKLLKLIKIGKIDKYVALFSFAYALVIGITLRHYLIFDATLVVGLAVLPFCFTQLRFGAGGKSDFSMRYIFWLLPTLILAVLTHSFTFFYLAAVGAVLLIWESKIGKLSILAPILFIIISPIFRYVTDVFTFDFRLKLTALAARVLQKIDPSISPVGNLIKLKDGSEWQIDEACMGLNMLGISLILTIFFIAYFAKKEEKQPILRGVIVLTLTTLFLNIVCNLLRIIALVHFRVLPHTVGHDTVGLLALVIYVVAPIFFLIKKATQYDWFFSNKNVLKTTFPKVWNFWKGVALHTIILLILISKSIFLILEKPDATADQAPKMTLSGFQKTILPNGICQFSNDSFLIYVKPLRSFYTTEHSPMVCWRGSGFEFKQIEKKQIGKSEVYTGILAKGDSTIYTAWWFENERGEHTIEQKTWRWAAFTEGVHFELVNVNATDSLALRNAVGKFISR